MTNSPPPAASQVTTRRRGKQCTEIALGLSREEILGQRISPIRGCDSAKRFLESKSLVIEGDPYTISSLSMALLHLSQANEVSKGPVLDGLRAVAILLMEIDAETTAKRITTYLTPSVEDRETGVMEEAKKLAAEFKEIANEIRAERNKTLQGLATAVSALEQAPTFATVVAKGRTHANPVGMDTSGRRVDLATLAMATREDAKARQVLIDESTTEGDHAGLKNLNEKELLVV